MRPILDRYGIPQLFDVFKTTIPSNATNQIKIGNTMPTNVAVIYGLSLCVDSVDDANVTLLTNANAVKVYLTLKQGTAFVINNLRLDKLVFNPNLQTLRPATPKVYFDTWIPGSISLDTSFYSNPTGLTSGEIMLEYYYLSSEMVTYLVQKGAIFPKEGSFKFV